MVLRLRSTPSRFHICSCRYSGSASAYFFTMMSVTTEAEAYPPYGEVCEVT